MIVVSGYHVGAAADHGGQCLRAALEVDELDLETGLVVFAEFAREHRRQVTKASSAAHRDRDLGFAALRSRNPTEQDEGRKRYKEPPYERAGHDFLPKPFFVVGSHDRPAPRRREAHLNHAPPPQPDARPTAAVRRG